MIPLQGMAELYASMNILWLYLSKTLYYVYKLFFLLMYFGQHNFELRFKHKDMSKFSFTTASML